MDNKVNYALVGLFVVVLSVLLLLSILWLSAGTQQKTLDTYQAYIEESVSGLNLKAPVKYRGVDVGYVEHISLVSDRPNDVYVLLKIERGTPIKEDTFATLTTQGLTGLAYVDLNGGSPDALVPIIKQGELYPEIKTKPSLLVQVDTAISTLTSNLSEVTGVSHDLINNLNNLSITANNFFSKENQIALSNILQHTDTITGAIGRLAVTVSDDRESSINMGHFMKQIAKTSDYLPNLTKQLEKNLIAIEKATYTLFSKENNSIIAAILQQINTLSASLSNKTDILGKSFTDITQLIEHSAKVSKQLPELIVQLQKSLAAIEKTAYAFTQTTVIVGKTVDASRKDIAATSHSFAQAADDVKKAVKEGRRDLTLFTGQTLPEINKSIGELNELLINLRNFSRTLEREPSMILFGKSNPASGPGE